MCFILTEIITYGIYLEFIFYYQIYVNQNCDIIYQIYLKISEKNTCKIFCKCAFKNITTFFVAFSKLSVKYSESVPYQHAIGKLRRQEFKSKATAQH